MIVSFYQENHLFVPYYKKVHYILSSPVKYKYFLFNRSEHEYEETGSEGEAEEQEDEEGQNPSDALVTVEKKQNGEYENLNNTCVVETGIQFVS